MVKRSIALLIIISLLLSIGIISVAEPLSDIENNPHRSAIEQMVKLGILSGRGDGQFYPNDNLTRAEAAKVAMSLAGFDDQDAEKAISLPQAFDDVYGGMGTHEWALGWINLAAREDIIGGYGDGKYGPGDNLQMAQWAAILIRILGHETEGLEWPTGYDQLAGELGLTKGLEYKSASHIRRDQMAKFAANAVYNVECSDGSKIIDLLGVMEEDIGEDTKDQLESINISLFLTPKVLPEGGGQTTTIGVTVTDKSGKPVEGAKVVFHAFAFELGERNAQLSQAEIISDKFGKAMVTYTSLVSDDKKMVEINVSAFKDQAMDHVRHKIMAANQAAVISGVVRNPYTGDTKEGVHIHFMNSKTNKSIGFSVTDEQGRYSMVVPIGTYHVTFEMPIRDQITVNVSNPGQTYTIDNDKGILKGVVSGVSPGKMVMAIGSNFNRSSPDNWTLQAEIQDDGSFTLSLAPDIYELFIVGSSNPFKTGLIVQSGQVIDIGP